MCSGVIRNNGTGSYFKSFKKAHRCDKTLQLMRLQGFSYYECFMKEVGESGREDMLSFADANINAA